MKFLILNTDYPEFLHWLYAQNPGLEEQPYAEQIRVMNESLFGVADFYSSNLRKLGHEGWDIHVNNEFMQKAWAREHRIRPKGWVRAHEVWRRTLQETRCVASRTPARRLKSAFAPLLHWLDGPQPWFYDILSAQVGHYRPDILLNQNMLVISSPFLRQVKPHVRLIVGQHAVSSFTGSEDFTSYDLTISSFPPTIEYFRGRGLRAELNRLGFEPKVLSRLRSKGRDFGATFIGSLFPVHSSRAALLESVCARFPQVKVWGQGIERLPPTSPIRGSYMGQAWGLEMFEILWRSKITLNHHGDVGPYANNMRLFEATGVGTLLITDWKQNLREMFEPGKEVVAYRSNEECAEFIQYYLDHDEEREAIAHAGQERTLRGHTYYHRMQELVDVVRKYL